MTPTNETSSATPAYPPWKTFTNTLDALARNMPNRIDRSAFPGQSGGGINQLLTAFKFFGFMGDDGKPTPALLAVAVTDEAARKNALRKLIEQKYASLIALNLTKTTPAEFAEKMTEVYKVSGDTRLKATRFFLAAAEYLGIQVSPLLLRDRTKVTTNGTSTRRRRVARTRTDDDDDADGESEETLSTPAAESRSVELRSGGTLTLSATTKFMALSAADRKFVFDLIDKLEEYESQNGFVAK
ncbi:MAG: hypothetical protein WBC51_01690 [Vicinamibacterales bacterium]